ncbi:recombinase family protein [Citrobacter portucalensis]|uniref:recombinase family protein n=1 Tax=Citrobacter portucalensis TaxID=1639133 RepID=UPI00226B4B5E|nr:recombinase family protein [Citrobacter portucalensis]MCX8985150.1 recombinase family protein [Citrobacter portucalensis]
MSRDFSYCRVSTTEQTAENQILAIEAKGYTIDPQRRISETISGSVCAMQRKEFANLVNNKLEAGDRLIVLKLDRLGRDSIDVQQTVKMLLAKKINIVCLDLPHPDLSSAEGVLMLQMFSAFAEFERNRIIERTREGLARANKQGKHGGRPPAATPAAIQKCRAEGMTQAQAAAALGVSVRTIKRSWNPTT